MSDIKLVLTDFDGTVVESGRHVVSDAVRRAVIACEDKGIRMIPITGRYRLMTLSVLELLGFEDYGVFDNGATIQNCKTGEIIWSKWMKPETVRVVARICAPHARNIDYSELHNEHEPADNEHEHIERVVDSAPYVYACIYLDKVDQIKKELDSIKGITYYLGYNPDDIKKGTVGIQINDINADKYHGAKAIRNILGISKRNTLAIGDGENDIALFRNAGTNVAMGNAIASLKELADYVTDTVGNDGFAIAMDRYVLNK
jgi:Cof subfamily protein (haloacid dehalogenase superfamily)